jgi:hypothetical protein
MRELLSTSQVSPQNIHQNGLGFSATGGAQPFLRREPHQFVTVLKIPDEKAAKEQLLREVEEADIA